MGSTPFCVAGIWNGYADVQAELPDDTVAKDTWRAVIQHLLENYDWSDKQWVLSENVFEATFLPQQRKLAGPGCYDTAYGWYSPDKNPGTCNGGSDHIARGSVSGSAAPAVELRPLSGAYVRAQRPAQYRAQPGAHGRAQLQRL